VGEHFLLAPVVDVDEGVEAAHVIAEAGVGVVLLGWVGVIAALGAPCLLNLLQHKAIGCCVVGRLAFPAVVNTGLVKESGCIKFLTGRSIASGVVVASELAVALGGVGVGD
jgi:hypothetical protein